MTIHIDFIRWLKARGLSQKTLKQYNGHFKMLEKERKGDLDQELIENFVINHPTYIARAFLNNLKEFFEDEGYDIKFRVPKSKGRKKQKQRKTMKTREINSIRRWLNHNKPLKYLVMFDLSYTCALRREEVLNVNVKDFRWKDWDADGRKRGVLLIRGKGKRERIVSVPEKTMHRCFKYAQSVAGRGFDSFFNIKRSTWHNTFKKAVNKMCDYNYSLHDLRRSRATHWHNSGISLNSIKIRLGHASIVTTQKYILSGEEEEMDKWQKEKV